MKQAGSRRYGIFRRFTGAMMAALAVCGWLGCSGMGEPEELVVSPDRAYRDARSALLKAASDPNYLTRTHAMEALGETLGAEAGNVLTRGLMDQTNPVRFAAAMALGDVAFAPAKPHLLRLVEDPGADQRVVCAAIYALYRIGHDKYAGQLGYLLTSDFDQGRACAAQAMGKMGEPSAMGPLKSLLADEQNSEVQLAALEALSALGDNRSMQSLEAKVKGYFLDERLIAIPALARSRSPRAQQVLTSLLADRNPPRVRVAAAGGLAQRGQGDDRAYRICLLALTQPDQVYRDFTGRKWPAPKEAQVSSLRQLAARALGCFGRAQVINVLHPLLKDPDGSLRVAAAMSALRILAPSWQPTGSLDMPALPAPAATPGRHPSLHTSAEPTVPE